MLKGWGKSLQLHRVTVSKYAELYRVMVGTLCALLGGMTLQTIALLVSSTLDVAAEFGITEHVSKPCAESLKAAALGRMDEAESLWRSAAKRCEATYNAQVVESGTCQRCDGTGLIVHAKHTEFCDCEV